MEVQIVKFFQGWSNSFLDVFFGLITKMGEETFFLLVLMITYHCYSERFALKLLFYYLISVAFNNIMKIICKRARPYVASSEVVDGLHANGYSFPSGHTQGYFVNVTTINNEIFVKSKNTNLKFSSLVVFLVLGILVMLSRMYWGQHYLSDVIVGMMFGIGITFFLDFLLQLIPIKLKEKITICKLYILIGCLSIVLMFGSIMIDVFSGVSLDLIYKFSAIFFSMSIGYFVNKGKIKYLPNQGFMVGVCKSLILVVSVIVLYVLFDMMWVVEGYWCLFVYLFLGLFCTIILPIIYKLIFKKGYENEKSDS